VSTHTSAPGLPVNARRATCSSAPAASSPSTGLRSAVPSGCGVNTCTVPSRSNKVTLPGVSAVSSPVFSPPEAPSSMSPATPTVVKSPACSASDSCQPAPIPPGSPTSARAA
jgi:hypothetical protein